MSQADLLAEQASQRHRIGLASTPSLFDREWQVSCQPSSDKRLRITYLSPASFGFTRTNKRGSRDNGRLSEFLLI
jgi:hypothetical protein